MNGGAVRGTVRKPFIEHIHELQKRLMWVVAACSIGGLIAYQFNTQLLALVQRPLGQTLYYTSPTGGFSFLFKLCITAGFVLALPVVLYHIFGFLAPLIKRRQRLSIIAYTLWSLDLAWAGVLFAYLVSLPAALHFLAKFGGSSIQSLITADEYFSFALAYIAGFAVLFQLPLLILFINRIKPLRPSGMMRAQRYVILGSFIVAAILTPTPDPFNQTLMALPAVVLYQVGIVLVAIVNRKQPKQSAIVVKANVVDAPALAPIVPIVLEEAETVPKRPKMRVINDILPPSKLSTNTFGAVQSD